MAKKLSAAATVSSLRQLGLRWAACLRGGTRTSLHEARRKEAMSTEPDPFSRCGIDTGERGQVRCRCGGELTPQPNEVPNLDAVDEVRCVVSGEVVGNYACEGYCDAKIWWTENPKLDPDYEDDGDAQYYESQSDAYWTKDSDYESRSPLEECDDLDLTGRNDPYVASDSMNALGPNMVPVERDDHLDYDELDPLIRPFVRTLRCHGIDTAMSCQGGIGHPHLMPWISFVGDRHTARRVAELADHYAWSVARMDRSFTLRSGRLFHACWTLCLLPLKACDAADARARIEVALREVNACAVPA